jgi:hypothetical protein
MKKNCLLDATSLECQPRTLVDGFLRNTEKEPNRPDSSEVAVPETNQAIAWL